MFSGMSRARGMTLVEVMVAVGVVGALLAILVPGLAGARARARESATVAQCGLANERVIRLSTSSGDAASRPAILDSARNYSSENHPAGRPMAALTTYGRHRTADLNASIMALHEQYAPMQHI